MNRKLKALGLALVAAFAMSAVVASGASASGEQFHSSVTHTTLDSTALNTQIFETDPDTIECTGVSVTSTINAATVSEITATPKYTGCIAKESGLPVHVNMRSCDYLFTAEATPHAQVHIKCTTAGDHIRVNATFLGAEVGCVRVPPQTPTSGGVTYANNNGHVDITATVTGIEYTTVGICEETPVVKNNGVYTGQVTVSGTDTSGNKVTISHG